MKLYLKIFFTLLLISNDFYGQKKIIINNDSLAYYAKNGLTNLIKYSENRLIDFNIKPNSFPDGDYVFYRDSSTNSLLFEGKIKNGLTNGIYYFNKACCNKEYKLNVKNGKINDVYKNRSNFSFGFNLYFEEGILKRIDFFNPFLKLIDERYDKPLGSDTLILLFENGKLNDIKFENKFSIFEKIQPKLKQEAFNNNLKEYNEISYFKIYNQDSILKIYNQDSVAIKYYKLFDFYDKQYDLQKKLFFEYDIQNELRRIYIYTEVQNENISDNSSIVYLKTILFPLNILFDSNNFIKEVELTNDLVEFLDSNESNELFEGYGGQNLKLYFSKFGEFDNEK
jgi:hypothetical protein